MPIPPTDNVVSVDFGAKKAAKLPAPIAEVSLATSQKLQVFEEFLEGGIVSVAFDPRTPLTEVPNAFRNLSDLVLNYSYGYRIDDFRFDDESIRATLSFPQGYFYCVVPWAAIFSMHSEALQKSTFWPDDSPNEIEALIERKTNRLTLVKDDED